MSLSSYLSFCKLRHLIIYSGFELVPKFLAHTGGQELKIKAASYNQAI